MNDVIESHRTVITLAIHVLFLSAVVLYVCVFTYLLFQDFPQWVYHGFVFNQMVFHANNFGGFFWFHNYIPPNASATVIIGLFNLFLSPTAAGKLFVVITVWLVYFGLNRVLAAFTQSEHPLFASVSVIGTLNLFLYMGYMNYLFGLGIALIFIAWVARGNTNAWMLTVFFLLGYCSHFVSLLLMLCGIGAIIIAAQDVTLLRKTAIAIIPSCGLFLHYYFSKQISTFSSDVLNVGYMQGIMGMLIHFPAAIVPFHRIKHVFEPDGLAGIVNIAMAVCFVLLILLFLVQSIRSRKLESITVLGVGLLLIVLFSPPYLSGLFYLGERFVPLLFVTIIAYHFLRASSLVRIVSFAVISLIGIAAVETLWNQTDNFNRMNMVSVPSSFRACDPHGGTNPFFGPYYYNAVEQQKPIPVFHHALLDYRGAQNTKPFDN